MSPAALRKARLLLCSLEDHIRDTLIAERPRHASRFADVAAVTASDTIYHVDKISEEAILGWFEAHWPKAWPVELVMEGLESEVVTFPKGTPPRKTLLKCIIDPVDGTRNLMYDKRSAWILAALAPQRGARNHLGDIVVAAMTELPTSKQWRSDQVSAVRGQGIVSTAIDVRTGARSKLSLRPSGAKNFHHGFASFVKFFPEGKALTARIEEALWDELHGLGATASPTVFDDQYITTGGQIYELLCGHDRMIGDLRPLILKKLGFHSSLVCHPYDICTALLLKEAGGVIEDPMGGPVRAPLDTISPVSWIGYANPALARLVRPTLKRLLLQLA